MPSFTYAAIDANGATIEGSQRADTMGDVRTLLLDRNLYPVRIEEKRGLLQLELTREKVDKKALLYFTRQLAVFVQAGVAITVAMEVIGDEATDAALRRALVDMSEDLRNGGTLSDAMTRHETVFPNYYVGIVRASELTGRLDEALESLGDYMQRELDTKSKVMSALTYPAVVFMLSLGTVALLAGYVLPRFKPLFEELGAELPLPTRMMLGVSTIFTVYLPVVLGVALLFITVSYWLFKSKSGKPYRDRFLLKIPVLKGVISYQLLERFCRMLSTMLSAGVPLIDGFRTTTDGTDNIVYREKFEQVQATMLEGGGFARPLAETDLFPGAAKQMFKVGEETGTLDRQLQVAAQFFGRELEDRVRKFTAMFEPLLIIFIGAVVGFVALALVSAMYGVMGGTNA
jgi:type IV pilus assembly protein PilC